MVQAGQEQSRAGGDWKQLRRGWCFGGKTFREELLGLTGDKQTEHHYGEEIRESAVQKAERLVEEQLKAAGWTEKLLAKRRKGDKLKVQMARRLREETTVNWKWIAERLKMGHWRSAANAVRLA